MNVKTKMGLTVVTCLTMGACNTITGTMSVDTGQTLNLRDKNGQVVTLSPGNASVTMKSGKLVLKGITNSGNKDSVELDALKNLLPEFQSNGEHVFLAKDTGQPVDID